MRADIFKGTRHMLATAAATASLLVGFTGAAQAENSSPEAAAAAECTDWWGPNIDTGSGRLRSSYNLKNAPYARCDSVASLGSNTLIYFHCWAENDHGNWWVYGRVANTQTMGWMSVDNFSSYTSDSSAGAKPRCNLN